MRYEQNELVFSPSDLCNFYESRYRSWMDRCNLERPGLLVKDEQSAEMALLSTKGDEHEQAILTAYEQSGCGVVKIERTSKFADAVNETRAAIENGAEVIFQGALQHGRFAGWSDFLERVPSQSGAGGHPVYRVADTKLARKPKPYFLIQLCAYAEMLEALQGTLPDRLVVIAGDNARHEFRTEDYFFFYKRLKKAFLDFQDAFDPEQRELPDPRADHGPWQSYADQTLAELDHPSRVAGITAHQVKRLRQAGITTLTQLAETTQPQVPKMEESVFLRLRAQAALQLRAEAEKEIPFEVVKYAPEERQGLAALPPASELDVYFDIEGYPLVDGGLEYLLGVCFHDGKELGYRDFWAHDAREEKHAFELLVDWLTELRRRDPKMHIYHYANYEVAALRRLMGKHGTREEEVDQLLRGEVFVDLYRVVKQGLRVGVPSYSLKYIEHLYRGKRGEDVKSAAQSVVEYANWIEKADGDTHESSSILKGIRDYNIADCESTAELTAWLRLQQRRAEIEWVPPREKKEKQETQNKDGKQSKLEEVRESDALARRLLDTIPTDRSAAPERWRIQELLAQLIGFHRREDKPFWWRIYDAHAMTEAELVEDAECLGALTRTEKPSTKEKRSQAFEFRFDADQDTKLAEGAKADVAGSFGDRFTIHSLDRTEGLVELKRQGGDAPPDRLSLVPYEYIDPKAIARSIRKVAEALLETGGVPSCLEDLLGRQAPRLRGRPRGEPIVPPQATDLTSASIAAVNALDGTTLTIQGPPGTGKTYTAARCAAELIRQGKRVGITSNGHKAIEKLMEEILEVAGPELDVRAVKVGGGPSKLTDDPRVRAAEGMKGVVHEGANTDLLVGGTCFAFSDDSAAEQFDCLFVDEAGQVSLANVVGASRATRNIVLVGDQMQLGQPIKGSHPGDSGQSALEYLLHEHATVPEEMGIFLAKTRRLHPELCSFISGAIYEGRLAPTGHARERCLRPGAGSTLPAAGLCFVPVEHEGNAQASDEEVEHIGRLIRELLGARFVSENGERALGMNDIMIVAPYNAQVRRLQQAYPNARVGTVDKFQGQEAAIVIVSMCASSAEGSLRGIEFLLNPNRLNVALSRAQCLALVVGSPGLSEARASTVKQMKLVNLLCRILEEDGYGR